ncbi:MAG: IPTL-CTERM sorting domain-containing protein [Zoogloea sp.]|nr:IPTL-CTERM sorting domain-containing protein [Zoogloea sp.]
MLQISAPGQPENVQTTPGFQSVTVSWSVPLTGGTPASYTVTAYLGGVSTGQTCTVNYPAVSCAVTGLTNGQFYTFVVAAENAGGTTPANATAAVQPAQSAGIPTLSEWAQILLVLSMIGMTGWYSRRRYS